MSTIDVDYVRQLLTDIHSLLAVILSERPKGAVQRQLIADQDEKTFHELARLKNRCLRVLEQLGDDRP